MDESNLAKLKAELNALVREGEILRISMAYELGKVTDPDEFKKQKFPEFKASYERWYSLASRLVKQLLPDRLPDFTKLYRDEKKKQLDFLTYGIADYMLGISANRGFELVVDKNAAFPKFEQQLSILKAAQLRFDSALYDLVEVVQANLFDSELDAAKELLRKGFARAAGAMAGVVLERHLGKVAPKHNLKPKRRHHPPLTTGISSLKTMK